MLIVLTLIIGTLVVICPFVLNRSTNEEGFKRQARTILFIWIGVTILLTLGIRSFDEKISYNLRVFQCYRGLANQLSYNWRTYRFGYNAEQFRIISSGICNILINVLLFMPYGYLMTIVFPKRLFSWKKVLLAGITITVFIETMQLVFHRGCFDLDDLFHNTIGIMFGYFLGKYVFRLKDIKK